MGPGYRRSDQVTAGQKGHLPAPMASSLLALIDDIATVLDDVALLTKVAAKKTVRACLATIWR